MPSILKRGNIYYVYWVENGVRKGKAVSPDKQTALEYKNRLERDLYRQKAGLSRPSASWQEFCNKYLEYSKTNKSNSSYIRDRHTINTYNRLFKIRTVSEFTADNLEGYKRKRKAENKQESSINRELNTLKNIGSKMLEWSYTHNNPVLNVKRFKIAQNKVRFLTLAEIDKILSIKGNHNVKLALQIGLYTGARASEVLFLRYKNINLLNREITIENKEGFKVKERKAKVIPMNDKLYAILKDLKGKPDDYLIKLNSGEVLSQLVKRQFGKLGIKDASFHTLRHTFASHLLGAGVSPFEVAKFLGHNSLNMIYSVYGHVIPGHISQNISKLPY